MGRYFDLNPAVFRVGFVVLTLLGGAGVLVYLAAALVMPGEGKEHSLVEQVLAERKERPWPPRRLDRLDGDGDRAAYVREAKCLVWQGISH